MIWRAVGVVVVSALLMAGCSETPSVLPQSPASDSAAPSGSVTPSDPAGSESSTPSVPDQVSMDLLVTGNTSWGRYIEQRAGADTAWPFSGLAGFDRASYDGWISTLECPAVNSDDTLAEQEELLKFHCPPRFLPEAAKWFTAFSLADNHTDNQGVDGLAATHRNLDRAGIAWFGGPDPEVLDEVCKPIPIQVHVDSARDPVGWLPVAFCGYHGVYQVPSRASIDQIRPWASRLPVIVMPHSGLEYVPAPDSIKTRLYRSFIDAGADVVLGDHAHWVQTSQAYRGRLIVYGMGNFIFDQQGDLEKRRSAAIHVRLDSADPQLGQWLAVGEQCHRQPAACASLVTASDLPELQASWGFGVVGTTNPGMLTQPATPAETAAIKLRLRWAETMAGLRAPYGPLV